METFYSLTSKFISSLRPLAEIHIAADFSAKHSRSEQYQFSWKEGLTVSYLSPFLDHRFLIENYIFLGLLHVSDFTK